MFCEGGGNAWGLDFDHLGNLYYSTNHGGYVLVHGVQGGYFIKSFAKHGALHNPHTYGHLKHAPHAGFQGGHVTVGGLVYGGGSFPQSWNGRYISGDLLGHGIHGRHIERRGSSVATSHGDELLLANDTWFAPTDVTTGPDGAVYVADWHDQRTAHPDPDAEWDRSNGRIYRIAPSGTPRSAPLDYATLSTVQLLQRHQHPNQWHVRRARQELVRRKDETALASLRHSLLSPTSEISALEILWSVASTGNCKKSVLLSLLDSPQPEIRFWTLRLLGDAGTISERTAHRLDILATREPDVWVRQQLACTAKRLPAKYAVPIIHASILRDIDIDDPYLPLLLWWAVEHHCVSDRDEVISCFVGRATWHSKLGHRYLLPRLVRRYAAEGTKEGLNSVVKLLNSAPTPGSRAMLWEPIFRGLHDESGWMGKRTALRVHPLAALAVSQWEDRPDDIVLHRLAIRVFHQAAMNRAVEEALRTTTASPRRIQLLEAMRIAPSPKIVRPLLRIIESGTNESVRVAALQTLSGINDNSYAQRLIGIYRRSASGVFKSRIRDVLLERRVSARVWLETTDRGEMSADETPITQIRQVALLDDPHLNQLVIKHWGRVEASSREEKLAEVRRLNNDVRAGPGNPVTGRMLFKKHCATCHQLFGEGQKVGPDLTTANRLDSQAMLISLVDPSSVIRREYTSVIIQTVDGRVVSGLPVAEDENSITLINNSGKQLTIASNSIEESAASPISLMPENLYRQLAPQQLRDLFAWLQSSGPDLPSEEQK